MIVSKEDFKNEIQMQTVSNIYIAMSKHDGETFLVYWNCQTCLICWNDQNLSSTQKAEFD